MSDWLQHPGNSNVFVSWYKNGLTPPTDLVPHAGD